MRGDVRGHKIIFGGVCGKPASRRPRCIRSLSFQHRSTLSSEATMMTELFSLGIALLLQGGRFRNGDLMNATLLPASTPQLTGYPVQRSNRM